MSQPTARNRARSEGRGAESYRARDLLANRKVIVDTVLPVIVFVSVNAVAGLSWAAAVSVGLSLGLVALRVVTGQRLLYAVSGLGGTIVAVATALWSGGAEGYFGPGLVLNAAYAVGAAVSILVRRPLIAWSSAAVYRWPLAWYWHPRVRPAYSEVTWAWAALFAARAYVRYRIVSGGRIGLSETVVVLATGWPAFAVLLVATYAYVNWRLRTLDAPSVEQVRAAGAAEGAAAGPASPHETS